MKNDIAVVTGGASGIGFALAAALADRGLRIVIADIDGDRAGDAARRLGSDVEAWGFRADVTQRTSVASLVAFATERGRPAFVAMNAGITTAGSSVWETGADSFDAVTSVNLGGLFNCIEAFVPVLHADPDPSSILVTASMAGLVASGYSGAYAASKAGAIALARAMANELAVEAPQVSVSVLAPGMVKTDLMRTSRKSSGGAALDEPMAEMMHAALNDAGVEPADVARWALDAVDGRRFWALPPEEDVFTAQLRDELGDLTSALPAHDRKGQP